MYFDFNAARAKGASEEQIIDYLRQSGRTNIDWESVDKTLSTLPEQTRMQQAYKWLQNNAKNFNAYKTPQAYSSPYQSPTASSAESETNTPPQEQGTPTAPQNKPQGGTQAQSGKILPQSEPQGGEVFFRQNLGFASEGRGATLSGSDEATNEAIANFDKKDEPMQKDIVDKASEFFGFPTKHAQAVNATNDSLIEAAAREGKDFASLSPELKASLLEREQSSRNLLQDSTLGRAYYQIADRIKGDDYAKEQFDKEKARLEIMNIKDPKNLTEEQRKLIAEDLGFMKNTWAWLFDDERETLKDYQENYKARTQILPDTLSAITRLDNIHQAKSIATMLSGGASKEEKESYLEDVSKIAEASGFDSIGEDKKGNLYFFKGEEAYKINDSFLSNFGNIMQANAGSLAGGLAGLWAGAKVGKTPQQAAIGGIAGGAIGAFTGGALDVAITNAYLNRETNFKELIAHATQEGALSLVGDVAALGIAKYGTKALSAMKSTEAWGKIIDYTPIVGFGKRALDGNASAAQELINKTYTKEQLGALQEAGNAFGAQLTLGNAKANAERITQAFGENSAMAKAYANITEALSLPSQRQRQQAFIQAIRADESGNLNAFLSEAAASSPKARENMRSILNLTTLRLTRELENLKLNKGDVKQIFDELESGTKSSYNEAMSEVLGKIYDESYKVNLNELKAGGTQELKSSQSLQEIIDLVSSSASKGRNMPIIGRENLSEDLLKWAQANNKTIAYEKAQPQLAQELGLPYPNDARRTIDSSALNHILNRHGEGSELVKNGQPPVTHKDIITYPQLADSADETFITMSKGQKVAVSFKQVNGHFVVIEQAKMKNNEVGLKTLFKGNGDYKNSNAYKDTLANAQTLSIGYEPSANSFAKASTPNSTTPTINKESFANFKARLESEGVASSDCANFLNFIEKNIYNDKGVSFTQLNNALKNLNSYYKEAKDPNFKSHIKQAMEGFIRRDIKAGIDAIFAQNKTAYKQASSLYESALQDYANMKATLKLADKLKIRNATTEQNKALDSLLKLAKGQGDKSDNITALTKALDKDNRAVIEMNMLQKLFTKSLYDDGALKVLDSGSFFKELESLTKGTFQSKEAQDFIHIVKGFDTLFKNDVLIAKALRPATTGTIGSSIATSIEGAMRMQVVKNAFSHIVRLMPHIPFLNSINQKVQGAALRYHLKSALESSYSISELTQKLNASLSRKGFNNDTKKHIESILKGVDKAQDEVIESAELAIKLEAQRSQKGNPLPEFGINYPEHYHQGAEAIERLLKERQGQVAGAFYREELGDIDLVWGDSSFGLKHILEKHPDDFTSFGEGESGVANALSEIIDNGKLVSENGVNTIWYKKDDEYYLVGLSKGFHKEGENQWVVTSYEAKNLKQDVLDKIGANKTLSADESLNGLQTFSPTDKSDSTTNPLNLLEAATLEREAQKSQAEAIKLAEEEAKEAKERAITKAFKDKQEAMIKAKEALAGRDELSLDFHIGEAIPMQKLEGKSSVSINDTEIYPLEYVKVKAKDLKPNFNANTATQTRTAHNEQTIESIANHFKPEMILGRGGFDDIPIILKDGQVIAGNHRVAGMQHFSPSSRAAYEKAVQEAHHITLKPDELLVRLPKDELDTTTIRALAASSNNHRAANAGDKVINALGSYNKELANLRGVIEAENADEMALYIAKRLDSNSKSPNIEATNLALLAKQCKGTGEETISNVFNALEKKLDISEFVKFKDAFVKNAGGFYNLSKDIKQGKGLGLDNLNLEPFLLYAIRAAGNYGNRARAHNFSYLTHRVEELLSQTDKSGKNALLDLNHNVYENLIGDILGASLARVLQTENPTNTLFHILRGAKEGLLELTQPTLLDPVGKALSEADIFDFITYTIKTGESSKATSDMIELLPALKEKYMAYRGSKEEAKAIEKEARQVSPIDTKETSSPAIASEAKQSTEAGTQAQKATEAKGLNEAIDIARKNIERMKEKYAPHLTRAGWERELKSKIAQAHHTAELESKAEGSLFEGEKVADILDKSKPLRMLEKEEITPELLTQAKEQRAKLWVGNLENKEVAQELGLDTSKPIKITMSGDAIAHIEKRHGAESALAKNGQPPIETQDYANHADIVNNADKRKIALNEHNQNVLISGKQVNGYFVVVETISTKDNELKLKTLYKENGKLEDSEVFKKASQDHASSGGNALSPKPSDSLDLPNANENPTTKQETSRVNLFGERESDTQKTYRPFMPAARLESYDNNLRQFLKGNHAIASITKQKNIQKGYKWEKQEVTEPRKFYHYTRKPKLNEFNPKHDSIGLGFWFVSEDDPMYKGLKMSENEHKSFFGDSKKEVYLSVKNPFLDGAPIKYTPIKDKENELKELFKDNKEALEFIRLNKNENIEKLLEHLNCSRGGGNAREFKALLESKGFDSINFDMHTSYGGGIAVFNPTQIKAVGNRGEFDTNNANIYHSNAHLGAGLVSGGVAGVETDENGNIIGFNPAKFAMGFLGGSLGSKSIERLAKNPKARAVMERIYLKKDIMPKIKQGAKVDTQDIIKILEQSPQKGEDKVLIGIENLNADVIAWAIKNNKKIPINTLDESRARELGFRIPRNTTRSITPSEVIHTLKRHGEESPMVKNGNQKPVTLEEISKYQEYADSAEIRILTKDKKGKEVLISGKQINGYYVIVEEVRKKVNELSFKSMYFEKGDIRKSNAFKNANHSNE